MKRQKTVEAYTCDCCGAEIDDRTDASITVRSNGDICYEWWAKGDYCERCADVLVDSILCAIPVPERYEREFQDQDACVACEVGLINSQRKLRGED